MILTNPEARRALRSVVQAVVALVLLALGWWVCDDLTTEAGRREALRWLFGIAGLGTFFYGLENTARAFKLSAGRDGIVMEAAGDVAAEAAQTVAEAAQVQADEFKP